MKNMAKACVSAALACLVMGCAGEAAKQGRGRVTAAPSAGTAGTPVLQGSLPGGDPSTSVTPGGAVSRSEPSGPGAAPGSNIATSAPSKPVDPIAIDQTGSDNPAGLGADEVSKLMAGGSPGSARLLYPYNGTVFPRGLLAPTIMWEGGSADVAYVHIHAGSFDYKAVLKVGVGPDMMQPQLVLPQDVWDKAGQHTNGKLDPFRLDLTLRVGGAAQGPLTLQFVIAQATVKGSIYYNSYASKLPGAAVGGNVLRIPEGGSVELFSSLECNGCHSVSANGSKMLSQVGLTNGGNAYDIVPNGQANPVGKSAGQRVSFGALYPDGSKYLSTATPTTTNDANRYA